ncbi:hypothetical protein [Bremerella sp. P1]|uniref:hypothetical protein n=1 Tax=Bremerella sp. P1 TaxID=3026424 RepID=UPI0023686825|nr:hypothetical protein [Bremerella sp. P1]WDI42096.1 hypothetical protein PSR63_26950 [Bremerella sp. P1]
MASNTNKTLKYKVAKFHADKTTRTLQSLVQSAIKKKNAAFDRCHTLDAVAGVTRLINYHGPYKSMRVGELLDYTKGHAQPYTKFEKKLESLPLQGMAPPEGSDFIHSIFYFAILENHVIISQSTSLRVAQFEAYLNWLLHQTGQLKDEQFVELQDQPPMGKTGNVSDATSIEMSAPVEFVAKHPGGDEKSGNIVTTEDHGVKDVRIFLKGLGMDVLKALLPEALGFPDGLSPDEIAMNRELVVNLELKWKKRRSDDSTKLLDEVAQKLRHVDDELDYKIKTKDGGVITKNDLKLSKSIAIGTNPTSKLPNRDQLWESMHEWLKELLEQNRVSSS